MSAFSFLSMPNRLAIGALLVVSLVAYLIVPLDSTLPIHWNFRGDVDATAPAALALAIAPVVGLALVVFMAALRRLRLEGDFDSGKHVIHAALTMVILMLTGLEIIQIVIGRGGEADLPRFVAFGMAALLIAIGNVLPKSQRNWVAGIRVPWTLRDADNWTVTHRWTGRLMVASGFVLAVLAIAVSGPVLLPVVLAAALVPAMAGIALSYAHAIRH